MLIHEQAYSVLKPLRDQLVVLRGTALMGWCALVLGLLGFGHYVRILFLAKLDLRLHAISEDDSPSSTTARKDAAQRKCIYYGVICAAAGILYVLSGLSVEHAEREFDKHVIGLHYAYSVARPDTAGRPEGECPTYRTWPVRPLQPADTVQARRPEES
jgi:hypothetical protein